MYREHIENYISGLEKAKAKNTCISYKRDLMQMEKYLLENEGAGPADYAELIKKDKSPATAARILSSMKGFFEELTAEGFIKENPVDGLASPKIVKNPRRQYSDTERQRILKLPCGYSDKAVRDRAMLAVMFDTGWKVSRLVSIELSEADSLPVSSATRELLEDYIYGTRDAMVKDTGCKLLFTNCDGKPMSRQGFWKIMRKYTESGDI